MRNSQPLPHSSLRLSPTERATSCAHNARTRHGSDRTHWPHRHFRDHDTWTLQAMAGFPGTTVIVQAGALSSRARTGWFETTAAHTFDWL